MCGIYAFQANKSLNTSQWKSVINNMKMLGIYNDSRGGDNIGILFNGSILKNKNFQEVTFKTFLEKNHKLFSIKNSNDIISGTILGHSRKGSVGSKLLDNAHPFVIPTHDGDNIIGVHNGTISNWKDLLKEYEISDKTIDNDSKAIYTIIAKTGNYDVFKKYIGAGTFLWTYQSNLEKLYIYKGKSLEDNYSKKGSISEERPLFAYYDKSIKGFYFSSLKEPLTLLFSDEENEIINLECNKIFQIENGKYLEKNTVEIDRSTCFQKIYSHQTNYGYSNHNDYDACSYVSRNSPTYFEDNTSPIFKNLLTRKNGFYYYNNMLASGYLITNIYTGVVENYLSTSAIKENVKKHFLKTKDCVLLGFHNGNLLKNIDDFTKALTIEAELKHIINHSEKLKKYKELSKYYRFPFFVKNLSKVYYNGEDFEGNFIPWFGNQKVVIKNFLEPSSILIKDITNISTGDIEFVNITKIKTLITNSLYSVSKEHYSLYKPVVDSENIIINDSKNVDENVNSHFQTVITNIINNFDEDEEEDANEKEILDNLLLFDLYEQEILNGVNSILKNFKAASEIASKYMKMPEYKKTFSYDLSSWLKDTIIGALKPDNNDSESRYIVDDNEEKISLNLKKVNNGELF